MDQNLIKFFLFFLLTLILLTVAATPHALSQDALLNPQKVEAADGAEKVSIWVNASDFQGGQINLTYDPSCVNITDFEVAEEFVISGRNSKQPGREFITFAAMYSITGQELIGTLDIQCNSECDTALTFDKDSAIFDPYGKEIPVDWQDGVCECLSSFKPQPKPTQTPQPGESSGSRGGGGGRIVVATSPPVQPTTTSITTQIPAETTTPESTPKTTSIPSTTPTPSATATAQETSKATATAISTPITEYFGSTLSIAALALVVTSIAVILYLIVRR